MTIRKRQKKTIDRLRQLRSLYVDNQKEIEEDVEFLNSEKYVNDLTQLLPRHKAIVGQIQTISALVAQHTTNKKLCIRMQEKSYRT